MRKIFVMIALLSFGAGVTFAEDEISDGLGDIEIMGEAKDKVKIKKFLPEIKVYVPDIVDSVTEKTEKLLQEGKKVPSEEDFKNLEYRLSDQTARPYLQDLPHVPLVSFYPEMAKVPVKRWELVINDDKGNTVRVIKGSGNPVKQIFWNGKDKRGSMLKVDSIYSYKFVVYDKLKNPHTSFGRSFKVDAVIYKDKKDTVMEFSNKYLFEKNSARFNPDSKLALEKAIDVLRTKSKYPFTIELYNKDPLGLLVKERQKRLCGYVSKEMLLMIEDVRYSVKRPGKRGKVTRIVVHR